MASTVSKKNIVYIGIIVIGIVGLVAMWWPQSSVSFTSTSGVKGSADNQTIIQKPNPTPRTITVGPEDLKGELISRSPNPEEAKQHVELALSLRNQEMLTRRAELRARQMDARLKEVKTNELIEGLQEDDVRRLEQFTIQTGDSAEPARIPSPPSRSVKSSGNQESAGSTSNGEFPLERFRVVGIFKEGEEWIARITRGGSIERVKTGYVLDGEIEVTVEEERVKLQRGEKTVSVYL